MRFRSLIGSRQARLVVLVALLGATSGCSSGTGTGTPRGHHGPQGGTLAALVGTWDGHTRYLTLRADGTGVESVSDGCCHPVVDVSFRVLAIHGRGATKTADVVVTAVEIHDPTVWSRQDPPPRRGQHGKLQVHDQVLTDSVTGATYCNEKTPPKPWVCGA